MAEPISDEQFADLAERTQAILELTEGDGWDMFVDRAAAEIQKHRNRILSGRLSANDYVREAGWVEGAEEMLLLRRRALDELHSVAEERAAAAVEASGDEREEELL